MLLGASLPPGLPGAGGQRPAQASCGHPSFPAAHTLVCRTSPAWGVVWSLRVFSAPLAQLLAGFLPFALQWDDVVHPSGGLVRVVLSVLHVRDFWF